MKKGFPFPMSKSESVIGWVWVFVHSFALVYILSALYNYVLPSMGIKYTDAGFNVVYYAVSFVFLLIFLFRYLRASFRNFTSNLIDGLSSIAIYYFVYNLVMFLISLMISKFLPDPSNPTQTEERRPLAEPYPSVINRGDTAVINNQGVVAEASVQVSSNGVLGELTELGVIEI